MNSLFEIIAIAVVPTRHHRKIKVYILEAILLTHIHVMRICKQTVNVLT